MPQTTIYAAPRTREQTPPPAVATHQLARLFGRSAALAGVSMRVERGRTIALLGLSLCAVRGGALHAADKTKAPRITYEQHILPVLKDKCVGCHNQDKKRGGLILNNYTKVMEGGSSGAAMSGLCGRTRRTPFSNNRKFRI